MDRLAVDVISPSFSRIKRKINADEENLQKCRERKERNRIHARNTRERKKIQVESIEQKIEDLYHEKAKLSSLLVDSTVAGILMTLSSNDTQTLSTREGELHIGNSSDSNATYRSIKSRISHELIDNEELDLNNYNIQRKNSATVEEMDCIRKERNRIHAKKARLRKKLILREMEQVLNDIQHEVDDLRVRVQLHHQNKSKSFSQSIENMTTDDHDDNINNTDLPTSNSFLSEASHIHQSLLLFDPSNYFSPDDVLVTGYESYSSSNDYIHNELRLPIPLPSHLPTINQPPPPQLHHYRDYLQDFEIINPFDQGQGSTDDSPYAMIPMPFPFATYSNMNMTSTNKRHHPQHPTNYPVDMSTVSFPLNPPPHYPPPWTAMVNDSPSSYYPYYLPAHPCSLFALPPATATLITTITSTTDASQPSEIPPHAQPPTSQPTLPPVLKPTVQMNRLPRNFSAPLSAYGFSNASTSNINRRISESEQHVSHNNYQSSEKSSTGATTTPTTTTLADHNFETKENQKSCNYLHVDSSLPPLSSFPIIVASSLPTSLSLQPPAAAAAPYPATATAPSLSFSGRYQSSTGRIQREDDCADCNDIDHDNEEGGWDEQKQQKGEDDDDEEEEEDDSGYVIRTTSLVSSLASDSSTSNNSNSENVGKKTCVV